MTSRTRLLLLAFSLVLLSFQTTSAAPDSPAVRRFEFSYWTRIPPVPAPAQKLRVWIPMPQSDDYQTISGMRITSPVPYRLHRDPEYHNHHIYLELAPGRPAKPIEVQVSFQVERREHLVQLVPAVARPGASATPPEELARALRPDRLVPISGQIADLAREQTRGLTQPLDKARAIYRYVVSTMKYDKTGEGWGRGDAIYACSVRKGNCTDFHALFIGMMRAVGIPARFEIGFPLPTDIHEGDIPGYHCWALFYLQRIGWVPVDASEAWKDPSRRDYFFGAHDTNRVLLTRGRDLRLNPAQHAEPLNYFIYPYAELDGKPFKEIRYKFHFRDLAPGTRAAAQ